MFNSSQQATDETASNPQFGRPEVRKKRDEYVIEIRRQKREEMLNKRRNLGLDNNNKELQKAEIPQFEADDDTDPDTINLKNYIDGCLRSYYSMEDFPDLVESINSKDRFRQHYGIIGIRKLLSTEANPPIQKVIDSNLVPKMISFMQKDDEPRLQLEATWALTNIASGTSQQTQSIIDKNGIPSFVRLLKSEKKNIAEQALWAIGNISGDSADNRDLILKYDGLEPLINIINNATNELALQHGVWALSNLCRGRPPPKFDSVKKAIPVLSQVIQKTTNLETLADAGWAMTFLSDGHENRIEMIVQTGIIPSLVRHLEKREMSELLALIPVLRTLGNILTGSERHTSMVLAVPGVVDKLFSLLEHPHKAVKREACWAISNLAGGNSDQLEYVMEDPSHIPTIIQLLDTDFPELRREAIWVLSNATSNASPEQIFRLCQQGLLGCFRELLESEDPQVLEIVLVGLYNILESGANLAKEFNTENKYLMELETNGAIQKIEQLQTHQSNPVYAKALRILENHVELEDNS